MRRYVSQDAFDSDQCGQTAETACKTVNPVLEQLHTMNSFVNKDLLDQVEDVWRKVLDKFQSILDQWEEWEYVPRPRQPFSTPSSEIANRWRTQR